MPSFTLRRRQLLTALPFMTMPSLMKPSLTYAQMRVAETTLDIFKVDVATHRLDDRVVTLANGRKFRIFRAIPKKAAPATGYPTLTLLDGNAVFDDLTAELLALVPDLVVIGLGYDTPRKFAMVERTLDYTPPKQGNGPHVDPARPERKIGGGFEFLTMLTGDLRSAAEGDLKVDPSRRVLGGHSFGGLMTLIALFRQPRAFSAYAPVSPSIWWAQEPMRRLERQAVWPKADADRIRLFIALGDKEQRSNDKGPAPTGPAPETMDLIARLSKIPALSVSSDVLEGHVHGATFLGALPQILRWAV
ncbi:alpha/beta hydrolase [Rhizobium helianthi]|uniref:Alpha/beta hydrolase n=1 Tax=Rhizobium helianthi TaxID=1132695 RepID=A0ABW4M2N9_9HYPH